MDDLRAMFPDANEQALQAVLEMSNNDVAVATNFLLGEDGAGGNAAALAALGGGGENNAAAAAEEHPGGDDDEGEEEGEEEDDEADEDGEEEESEEAAPVAPPPAKRLRVVEATDPAKLAGSKSNLARFDAAIFRKTHLDLLNLMPSKLRHTSITMWAGDVAEEEAALAMLKCEASGWWILHFPVSEIDHVWRVLVNAHVSSKAFGGVVHVSAQTFNPDAGGEVEVRVFVKEDAEACELKRVGTSLLSVAPSSHKLGHVFFVRGALKPGARDSKAKIEERSEYKLAREKRSGKEREAMLGGSRPQLGRPFFDTERAVYQLYKVEKQAPTTWVKVDA